MTDKWVFPEDVVPGGMVMLNFGWFPHQALESDERLGWKEGDPVPIPPNDYIFGTWSPSPLPLWGHRANYRRLRAVKELFPGSDVVRFYVGDRTFTVPCGTPLTVFPFEERAPVPPEREP